MRLQRALSRTLIVDFLVNMSASADVLAQAKVEIDLSQIPEGKNVSVIILHNNITPKLDSHTR